MSCRLCFAVISNKRVKPFTPDNGAQFVRELIQKCFKLALSLDDIVAHICLDCWTHLKDFHKFCEYVEHKQYTWRQYLARDEIEIGSEGPLELPNEIVDCKLIDVLATEIVDPTDAVQKSRKVICRKRVRPKLYSKRFQHRKYGIEKLALNPAELAKQKSRKIKERRKSSRLQKLTEISASQTLAKSVNEELPTQCKETKKDISETCPAPFNLENTEIVEHLQDLKEFSTGSKEDSNDLLAKYKEAVINLISPETLAPETDISETCPPLIKFKKTETVDWLQNLKELPAGFTGLLQKPPTEYNEAVINLISTELTQTGSNISGTCPPLFKYKKTETVERIQAHKELLTGSTKLTPTIDLSEDVFEPTQVEPVQNLQNADELSRCSIEPIIKLITSKCTADISKILPLAFDNIKVETDESLQNPDEPNRSPSKLLSTTDNAFQRLEAEKSEKEADERFVSTLIAQRKYNLEDFEKTDELTKPQHIEILKFQDAFQIFTIREVDGPATPELSEEPIEFTADNCLTSGDVPTLQTLKKSAEVPEIRMTSSNPHRTDEEIIVVEYLKCNICGATMETTEKLRQHCKVVHKKKKWFTKSEDVILCKLCNNAFANAKGLDIHMRITHARCTFCNTTFASKVERDGHIQEMHNSELKLTCPHCSQTFETMPHIYVHISLCHMDEWVKTNQPDGITPHVYNTTNKPQSKRGPDQKSAGNEPKSKVLAKSFKNK